MYGLAVQQLWSVHGEVRNCVRVCAFAYVRVCVRARAFMHAEKRNSLHINRAFRVHVRLFFTKENQIVFKKL